MSFFQKILFSLKFETVNVSWWDRSSILMRSFTYLFSEKMRPFTYFLEWMSFNNHLKNLVWSTLIGWIMSIYILLSVFDGTKLTNPVVNSGLFHFRVTFSSHLKSKVGNILTKTVVYVLILTLSGHLLLKKHTLTHNTHKPFVLSDRSIHNKQLQTVRRKSFGSRIVMMVLIINLIVCVRRVDPSALVF